MRRDAEASGTIAEATGNLDTKGRNVGRTKPASF